MSKVQELIQRIESEGIQVLQTLGAEFDQGLLDLLKRIAKTQDESEQLETIDQIFSFDKQVIADLLESQFYIETIFVSGHDRYGRLKECIAKKITELPIDDFKFIIANEKICQTFQYEFESLEFVEKLFKLDNLSIKSYLILSQKPFYYSSYHGEPKLYHIISLYKRDSSIEKLIDLIKNTALTNVDIFEILTTEVDTALSREQKAIHSIVSDLNGIDTLTKLAYTLSEEDRAKLEKITPLKTDSCKFDVSKLETNNEDVKKLISKFCYAPSEEKDQKIKELSKKLEKIAENHFFKEFIKLAANMKLDIVFVDEIDGGAQAFYKPTTKNIVIKNLDDFSTTIHELTHAIAHEFNNFRGSSLDSLQFAAHKVKGKLSKEEINLIKKTKIQDITPEEVLSLAAELKIEPAALQAEIDLIKSEYLEPFQRLAGGKVRILYPCNQDKDDSLTIFQKLVQTLSIIPTGYSPEECPSELIAFTVQALSEFVSEGISIDRVIEALTSKLTYVSPPPVLTYKSTDIEEFKKGDWIEIKGVKTIFGEDQEVEISITYDMSGSNSATQVPSCDSVALCSGEAAEDKPKTYTEEFKKGDYIKINGVKTIFGEDQEVVVCRTFDRPECVTDESEMHILSCETAESDRPTASRPATDEDVRMAASNLLQIVKFVAGHFRESVHTLIAEHEVENTLGELVNNVEVFAAVDELVTLVDVAGGEGALLDDAKGFSWLAGEAGLAAGLGLDVVQG